LRQQIKSGGTKSQLKDKYVNPYKDMSVLLRFENGNLRDLVRG